MVLGNLALNSPSNKQAVKKAGAVELAKKAQQAFGGHAKVQQYSEHLLKQLG